MDDSGLRVACAMSSGREPAKRSRTCSVCQGPTESYHLNYGVSSCFSCRAFFRRSVQDDKCASFKCKRKAQCDVTKTGGQKCKKCRFDQCIAAGMQPQCVMNKDQKKKRFRKCLERQMLLTQPPEPSLSRPNDDLCSNLNEIRYNKINRSSSRVNKPVAKDIAPSSNLKGSPSEVATGSSLPRAPASETGSDISTSSCTKFKSKLMRMYEEEVAAHDENQATLERPPVVAAFDRNECINLWNQSMSEIRFQDTWADELKRFHSPIADINGTAMRRHAYQAFIRDICRVFHGFARRLPMFRQLSKNDQQILLWRNPVNFVAFIMGRYYGAATNLEQLQRVFISDDGILPGEPLNFIGFCQRLDVKYSSTAIIQTNELSKQICRYHILQEYIPIVAHSILFYSDPTFSFELSMKQPIEQTFQMSCTNLADVFSNEYSAGTFFGDIFELSVSLFHGLRWVSEDIQLLIPPSYREEDDNWLLNQITQFSDSLYKIPLGKDHIDDIVEYCACDIPFRRNLFVFMANNYSQRLRPILEALNCNDGFPQKILDDMWNKAKIPSICVIIAKLESFENILELFTLVATAEDREHLRFRISPLKKPMKPLRMREVNACSKILSTALELKLTLCLERIGHIVRDDKLFFVFLAFILLKPVREIYPKSDMADFSSKVWKIGLKRAQYCFGIPDIKFVECLSVITEMEELMVNILS